MKFVGLSLKIDFDTWSLSLGLSVSVLIKLENVD